MRTYKNSWQTDETVLRIHILPKLGARAIDEIKTDAISELINSMRADGYASGTITRVIVILRYIYNLTRKWKTPGGADNPAAGLSAGPDVQRNRFLSEEEAEALVRAIRADQNQTAARAIMLLLLTGARRNEITFAKWDYVDWKNKTLLVPKSKSGRARVIALNRSAIALLTAALRIDGNPYIFPSEVNGRPPASLYFPWIVFASAQFSRMSACTTCATLLRASLSIEACRSTSYKAFLGICMRGRRSGTPTSHRRR